MFLPVKSSYVADGFCPRFDSSAWSVWIVPRFVQASGQMRWCRVYDKDRHGCARSTAASHNKMACPRAMMVGCLDDRLTATRILQWNVRVHTCREACEQEGVPLLHGDHENACHSSLWLSQCRYRAPIQLVFCQGHKYGCDHLASDSGHHRASKRRLARQSNLLSPP